MRDKTGSVARLAGKVRSSYAKLMSAPMTVGAILRNVLLLLAICFICVGPLMRTESYQWAKFSDWVRGLLLVWPVAFATLILRVADNYRRETKALNRRKTLAQRRSLSLVRAIGEIDQQLGKADIRIDDPRHVRDRILQCIVYRVAEVIGEGENGKITATLLDFSCVQSKDVDNNLMRVVSRSSGERETPMDYPRQNLVSWLAINDGKPRDVPDCWKDDRFERFERGYRSVVAVPIVRSGEAVAAVSIDHPIPYRFWGLIRAIEMALQPYIGIILLTYPQHVVGFPCTYDPSHSKVLP